MPGSCPHRDCLFAEPGGVTGTPGPHTHLPGKSSPCLLRCRVIPILQGRGLRLRSLGTCPKPTAAARQSWDWNPDRSSPEAVLNENGEKPVLLG